MRVQNGRLMFLLLFIAVALMAAAVVTANQPASTAMPVAVRNEATGTAALPAQSRAPQVEMVPSAPTAVPQSMALADARSLVAAQERVLTDLYENVLPSVVHIRLAAGQGSGFVWDREGHIVTNNHVVEGADQVLVTFSDGRQAEATVLGTDPHSDLAVIRVDMAAGELVPVALGDSEAVVAGQLAVALGNPFGLDNTMTVGIISAVGRTISNGRTRFSIPEVIQTDAPINPGNSGGPLLDREGRVIGINTQIVSETGSNSGIGFAVPISIAKRVVPALIADGEFAYAWLGISGQTVLPDVAEELDLPPGTQGVLVGEVTADGPADRAGLRGGQRMASIGGIPFAVGGDVIVAVNGQPITAMDELITYLVNSTGPGDAVALDILRDGRQLSLEVTLGERPATGG